MIGNQACLSFTNLRLLDMLKQLSPFDAFHHYEHVLVSLEGVSHLNDIRVGDRAYNLNLIPEELSLLAAERLLVDELHCQEFLLSR